MHRRWLGWLIGCVAWLYARTFRIRIVRAPLVQSLYAIWHEHLMGGILTNPDRSMVTIASRSSDGDIIAGALDVLGFPVARGSSSRGGPEALRLLTAWVNQGHSCAITVDGPRGPRHGVKPGIIALARSTGRPIVPCAVVAASAWRLGSWDRFVIPKPFSRIIQIYADPILVREADTLSELQIRIADTLTALNAEGEQLLHAGRD